MLESQGIRRVRPSIFRQFRKPNSVLFLRPDYHCTFAYRSEMIKRGWNIAIYSDMMPDDPLLFSSEGVEFKNIAPNWLPKPSQALYRVLRHTFLFAKSFRYEYHILYGRPPFFSFKEDTKIFQRMTQGLTDKGFLISLALARLAGIKMVFIPSGCRDVNLRADFQRLDDGNVCGNCGFYDRCDEKGNQRNLNRVSRYFCATIGDGTDRPQTISLTNLKWKSIDQKEWRPTTESPESPTSQSPRKVRVLHSHSLGARLKNGKNIKGSPAIVAAVANLARAGYPVELIEVTGVRMNEMRFHQATADIIVDQLIYGWWGSTGVEAMALGKPLVCYLRPEWKVRFLRTFPHITEIPVIEANETSIEEVLRQLVTDPELRRRTGEASREFAALHFHPEKNTTDLIEFLLGL